MFGYLCGQMGLWLRAAQAPARERPCPSFPQESWPRLSNSLVFLHCRHRLLGFWARDAQLRSVLCRPRNFERTQTNAWTGRARLEATGSARFSYRWQRLGFRPLHWPAAARDQRSRLWTALIAAPNDTGGNRVHTARRYLWVGGEAKDKGGGFLITPRHYGVVYHLRADAKATNSAV